MRIRLCKLLSNIFRAYLKVVEITGRVEVKNKNLINQNSMVGYWHGDSYCMQLVLKELRKHINGVNVIVTADRRGDVIEGILVPFGAKAIRLPDGMRMRQHFARLMDFSKETEEVIALSLDGPLGPLHEPKKLIFVLAAESKKQVAYIRFEYKRVLRLKHRWDKYVIPLPFSSITAVVEDLGVIHKEDIRSFEKLKQRIKY